MKKLVLIVSLVFVAASCQKENIVPNGNGCGSDRILKSNTVDPNGDDDTRGGTVQTISNDGTGNTGTGGTVTDPSTTTSGDDGTITDPMKKKDRKNN